MLLEDELYNNSNWRLAMTIFTCHSNINDCNVVDTPGDELNDNTYWRLAIAILTMAML
jgi:hypothetical protein